MVQTRNNHANLTGSDGHVRSVQTKNNALALAGFAAKVLQQGLPMKKILLLAGFTAFLLTAAEYHTDISVPTMKIFRNGRCIVEKLEFAEGEKNLLQTPFERSVKKDAEGRDVVNFIWKRGDVPCRVELASDPAGKELELTFGTSFPAFCKNAFAARGWTLVIPWDALKGKQYTALAGRASATRVISGSFTEDFKDLQNVRFLALGDGRKPDTVFDLNPRGVTDYVSDFDNSPGHGAWHCYRKGNEFRIHNGFTVRNDGGVYGAKIKIFSGSFKDYDRRHARRSYRYVSAIPVIRQFRFGGKPSKGYILWNEKKYDSKTGNGWLAIPSAWKMTQGASSGVLYSAMTGEGTGVFRFGQLDDGLYFVTVLSGNYGKKKNSFTLKINGKQFTSNHTVPDGAASVITIPAWTKDGKIDVEFSGNWHLSALALQPLMKKTQDCSIRRGWWAVEEFEPMPVLRSKDYLKEPEYRAGISTFPLPVPGKESAREKKELIREVVLPDLKGTGAEWRNSAVIDSLGSNISNFTEFQAAGALEKKLQSTLKKGGNLLMINGMLARHVYPAHREDIEKEVKRITEEAHKHNIRTADHQDLTLLWDLDSGIRQTVELTPYLQRSVQNYLPAFALCPLNPVYRKQYFEKMLKYIQNTNIDGLMIDEVQFNGGAFCGCSHCREAFHQETGLYLPADENSKDLLNRNSSLWKKWLEWRSKALGDWWVAFRREVMKIRPDFLFMTYTTHNDFVRWAGTWTGHDLFELMRSEDYCGTEIMSRNVWSTVRPTLAFRRVKNVLRKRFGTPVFGLVYDRNDPLIAYTGWALNTMNGQTTWFLGSSGVSGSWTAFKDGMNRSLAEPVAETAILFSLRSRNWACGPKAGKYNWIHDQLMGCAQVLDKVNIPYIFVDETLLKPDKLAGIKVLFVPAAPALSNEEVKLLKQFTENGGTIVITGGTGSCDDYGNNRSAWPFAGWFGGVPARLNMFTECTKENGEAFKSPVSVYFHQWKGSLFPDTKILLTAKNGTPLLMKRKVGKGTAFCLNGELSAALCYPETYAGAPSPLQYDPALDDLAGDLFCQIVGDNAWWKISAQDKIYTSVWQEKGKLFIHLFNGTGVPCWKYKEKLPMNPPKTGAFPALAKPVVMEFPDKGYRTATVTSPDFSGEKTLKLEKGTKAGTVKITLPVELLKVYAVIRVQ